ncbi:hypothetical protein BH18THE2_BH18THE2_29380 [soil metagenome]
MNQSEYLLHLVCNFKEEIVREVGADVRSPLEKYIFTKRLTLCTAPPTNTVLSIFAGSAQDKILANLVLSCRNSKSLLDIMHTGMRSDIRSNTCSSSLGITPLLLLPSPLTEVVGHSIPS